MNTAARVVGFTAALAVVFVAALGVGALAGPFDEVEAAGHAERHTAASEGAEHLPGGLMNAQDGYRMVLDRPEATAGAGVPVAFTITGPDGHPVSAYELAHGKELHLIAVRRDQTGFQHVHPHRDAAGTWRTAIDLTPGSWRLFADFQAAGAEPLTLGTDLAVPGTFEPAPPQPETRTARVDGYAVRLVGDLEPGRDSDLTLTVTHDGEPVTDLEPYLGAYGHLVALRDGDLAYLHVHPHESEQAGPEIRFTAAVPSAGGYYLYLDFKHGGEVRTVAFVVSTASAGHGH